MHGVHGVGAARKMANAGSHRTFFIFVRRLFQLLDHLGCETVCCQCFLIPKSADMYGQFWRCCREMNLHRCIYIVTNACTCMCNLMATALQTHRVKEGSLCRGAQKGPRGKAARRLPSSAKSRQSSQLF